MRMKNIVQSFTLVIFGMVVGGCGERNAGDGIPQDPEDVAPVLVGEKAPAFELQSAAGEPYRFDPDNRDRPAIIVFYRGGWCPFCTAHFMELRKAEDQILEMGFELLFVSADRVEMLKESLDRLDKPYMLLADNKMKVAQRYGVAYRVDPETVTRYLQHGIDLEAASGEKHHLLPVPAVFIVGKDGIIKFEYVNPNYRVRIDPDLLLAGARFALADKQLTPLRSGK